MQREQNHLSITEAMAKSLAKQKSAEKKQVKLNMVMVSSQADY